MANILIPFGKDGALFYGTPGVIPSAIADCFYGVKDLTVSIDKDEGDASRRIDQGWKDHRVGMKDCRLSFTVAGVTTDQVGVEDLHIQILREVFINDFYSGYGATEFGIALYARASYSDVNAGGMWGDFLITKFDRSESLQDLQEYSVEAVHTIIHGIRPTWSTSLPA